MRLVKLSDGCYVNPDDVQEVKVNDYADSLIVRMRGGIGHSVLRDYNKTIYDTLRRVKAELEGSPSDDPKKPD